MKYPLCILRYEDEINKRNNLENDFVILKKVSLPSHFFFVQIITMYLLLTRPEVTGKVKLSQHL